MHLLAALMARPCVFCTSLIRIHLYPKICLCKYSDGKWENQSPASSFIIPHQLNCWMNNCKSQNLRKCCVNIRPHHKSLAVQPNFEFWVKDVVGSGRVVFDAFFKTECIFQTEKSAMIWHKLHPISWKKNATKQGSWEKIVQCYQPLTDLHTTRNGHSAKI